MRSGDGDRRIRAGVERRRAVLADRDRLRVGDRLGVGDGNGADDVAHDRAAGDVEGAQGLTVQAELLHSVLLHDSPLIVIKIPGTAGPWDRSRPLMGPLLHYAAGE